MASDLFPAPLGRIITFYSFKGGVGRTMALANTAFLAATNGKRVLMMDWDLEAPGLFYYFRGMREGSGARAIRTAPGVLDLLWDWASSVRAATTVQAVEQLSERFANGAPFDAAVRPILGDLELEDDLEIQLEPGSPRVGRLDLIGAGSLNVATPEPTPYEDALARFDWTAFFSTEAGGTMLTSFRDWSKRNYDYVFIDSRTGFADVAGICTMQIPDSVVLCFIYNRQNIDGIAQVAGAIRDKRKSEVEVRAAPMRVARENTPEEADARARARKELTRRGRLTGDEVDRNLKYLSIRLAANVPFYETVAMIASDRPKTDPLVLNYLSFANELLGHNLELPDLVEEWVESVSRRLQPRQATADYVLKLRSTEPDRAIEEVVQFLDSVLEEGNFTDSDMDYLKALVDVSIHVARGNDPFDGLRIYTKVLDLLRDLTNFDRSWKVTLIRVLELYLEDMANVMEPDEELLLLDETDSLLATQAGVDVLLKRISNRRRAARVQLARSQSDAAEQITSEIQKLVGEASQDGGALERAAEILAANIDIQLLRGDIAKSLDAFERARRHYAAALKVARNVNVSSRPELVRLRFEVHTRLAYLNPSVMAPEQAARQAIEALKWKGASMSFIVQFVELGTIVNSAGRPGLTADYIDLGLNDDERSRSYFANFFGRSPNRARRYILYAGATLALLAEGGVGFGKQALGLLDESIAVLEQVAQHVSRPRSFNRGDSAAIIALLEEAVTNAAYILPPDSRARVAALRETINLRGKPNSKRDG